MIDCAIKTKILIVEDNEINAMFLVAALDSMGAVCEIAENGKVAVEMASSKKYDLIFMDCQMPVWDGYVATTKIRKLSNPFCEVPIVALTANGTMEDQVKCLDSGMDDCLVKPVEMEALEDIFEKYLLYKDKGYEAVSTTMDMQRKTSMYEKAVEKLMTDMRFSYQEASGLIDEYINTTTEIIIKMELAYAKRDYTKLVNFAHQIKGVSCNLRLKEIQKSITKIESMSKDKDENLFHELNSLKIIMAQFSIE